MSASMTLRFAFRVNGFDRGLAGTLDGAETVANRIVSFHGELKRASVDVRWLDLETDRATLVDQSDDLVRVVHVRR